MYHLSSGTCTIAVLVTVGLVACVLAQQPGKVAVSETDAYKNAQGPLYHNSDDIYRILSKLANASEFSITDAVSKRSHRAFRIARKTTSRGPSKDVEQQLLPTVCIICNQHARELITAELCMWLVRLLAGDIKTLLEWPEFAQPGRGAVLTGQGREKLGYRMNVPKLRNWINSLTSKFNFEVVPIVNIDGRDFIAESAEFSQRKNMDQPQVDLNRNWPVNRAQPGSGASELDRTGDEYHGPTSLSEWETRSLHSYMSQLEPKQRAMFIDVHSGMWAIMAPWGGKFNLKDIPQEFIASTQHLFDQMQPAFIDSKSTNPNLKGIANGPGSGMLYASQGSSDDTAYKGLGFSNVLTLEVYGPKDVWDSGWAFDCPTYADFQAVCTDVNLCANTVCSNRHGVPIDPMPGKKRDALSAAYVQAQQQLEDQQQQQQQQQQQSVEVSSDTTVDANATTTVAAQAFANVDQDPYMSLLAAAGSGAVQVFKFFNPHTPALYREVVARWLAAMLFAFEELGSQS